MPAKKKSNNKKKTGAGGKQPQSVSINEENAGGLLFAQPLPEPVDADPVSDAEKKARADKFKTLGNEAFKAKECVAVAHGPAEFPCPVVLRGVVVGVSLVWAVMCPCTIGVPHRPFALSIALTFSLFLFPSLSRLFCCVLHQQGTRRP